MWAVSLLVVACGGPELTPASKRLAPSIALTSVDEASPLLQAIERRSHMTRPETSLTVENARQVAESSVLFALDLERLDSRTRPALRELIRVADTNRTIVVENAHDPKATAALIGFGVAADAFVLRKKENGRVFVEFKVSREDALGALPTEDETIGRTRSALSVNPQWSQNNISDIEVFIPARLSGNLGSEGPAIPADAGRRFRRASSNGLQQPFINEDIRLRMIADHGNGRRKVLRVFREGSGVSPGALIRNDQWDRGYFQDEVTVDVTPQDSALKAIDAAPRAINGQRQITKTVGFNASFSVDAQGPSVTIGGGFSTSDTVVLNDFDMAYNEANNSADRMRWVYSLQNIFGSRTRTYNGPNDLYKGIGRRTRSLPDLAMQPLVPHFEGVYRIEGNAPTVLEVSISQRLQYVGSYRTICSSGSYALPCRKPLMDTRTQRVVRSILIDPNLVEFAAPPTTVQSPVSGRSTNIPVSMGSLMEETVGMAIAGYNHRIVHGTKQACVQACLSDPLCRSADYVLTAQRCHISYESRDTVPSAYAAYPDHVYLHRRTSAAPSVCPSGWLETSQECVKPLSGGHIFTQSQAAAQCGALGASLCSEAQVRRAYSERQLHHCAYAWTSESQGSLGVHVLSNRTTDWHCGPQGVTRGVGSPFTSYSGICCR